MIVFRIIAVLLGAVGIAGLALTAGLTVRWPKPHEVVLFWTWIGSVAALLLFLPESWFLDLYYRKQTGSEAEGFWAWLGIAGAVLLPALCLIFLLNYPDPYRIIWPLGIGVPAIVIFYFLKLRRQEWVISSTLLWRKAIEDLRVNAPFQTLRQNILLILQLLAFTLGVLAWAAPTALAKTTAGRKIILLIDNSASMNTRDVDGKTRLEAAREKALRLVDTLEQGEEVCPVTFDTQPHVLHRWARDHDAVRALLRGIQPRQVRTDIEDALRTCGGLAKAKGGTKENSDGSREGVELHIFTDGAFEVPHTPSVSGNLFVLHYVPLGKPSDNAGIVAMDLRYPETGEGKPELFLRIEYAPHERAQEQRPTTAPGTNPKVEITVSLYGGEDQDDLLEVKEVKLTRGGQTGIVFEGPPTDQGPLRVEIDHDDAFPDDNTAWVVLEDRPRIRTLVVYKDTNHFLEKAIASLPRLNAEAMDIADFDTGFAEQAKLTDDYDLVIFDRVVPKKLPEGNYFFFGTLPPLDGLGKGKTVDTPTITSMQKAHPVMRYLDSLIDELLVGEFKKAEWPKGTSVLLDSREGPLITAVQDSGRNILTVTFTPYQTYYWFAHPSYMTFMLNSTSWLGAFAQRERAATLRSGEAIGFDYAPEAPQVKVAGPGGSATIKTAPDGRRMYYTSTHRLGLYTAERTGSPDRSYAVNLLDSRETANAPAKRLQFRFLQGMAEANQTGPEAHSVWKILALIAIGVLVVEWYIYNRKTWI